MTIRGKKLDLKWLVSIVLIIAGWIWYASAAASDLQNAKVEIQQLKADQRTTIEILHAIDKRTERIEQRLIDHIQP